MRKRLTVIAVVALAVMMVAGTASTAGATEEVKDRREISVKSHRVWARGTGEVGLEANGTLRLALRGDAEIVDNAGDAKVHIRSVGSDDPTDRTQLAPTATYTLRDFDGVVWVTGTDFAVDARGKVRRMKVKGEGSLQLAGSGRWFTRHLHGGWGVTINFGAEREDST
jgi:hypothetical protein